MRACNKGGEDSRFAMPSKQDRHRPAGRAGAGVDDKEKEEWEDLWALAQILKSLIYSDLTYEIY